MNPLTRVHGLLSFLSNRSKEQRLGAFVFAGVVVSLIALVIFGAAYARGTGELTLLLSLVTGIGGLVAGYGVGRRKAATNEEELSADELARIVFERIVESENNRSGKI